MKKIINVIKNFVIINWWLALIGYINTIVDFIKNILKLYFKIKNNNMNLSFWDFIKSINMDWTTFATSTFIFIMFVIISNKYKKIEKKLNLKLKYLSVVSLFKKDTIPLGYIGVYFTVDEMKDLLFTDKEIKTALRDAPEFKKAIETGAI